MRQTADIIRDQNDRFRRGERGIPGEILITQGLAAHMQETSVDPLSVVLIVQTYDDFTEDNDPHKEHDFGRFELMGEICYWKIDLYDPDLEAGSSDPTDLSKTHRVLTIMLASDY